MSIIGGKKKCGRCKIRKWSAAFSKDKSNADGLYGWCKTCVYARLREKNRERGGAIKAGTLEARKLRSEGRKFCPRCKKIKRVRAFYRSGNSNRGRSSHCAACIRQMNKNLPAKTREERRLRYRGRDKKNLRRRSLFRKFKLTQEAYDAKWSSQVGLCAICGRTEKEASKNNKQFAVDHCHKTGKIRDLLCGACNLAIGFLREDPVIARNAAAYLERHKRSTGQDVIHINPESV